MPGMKSSLFSVRVAIYIVHVCANLLGHLSHFFDQYDSDDRFLSVPICVNFLLQLKNHSVYENRKPILIHITLFYWKGKDKTHFF